MVPYIPWYHRLPNANLTVVQWPLNTMCTCFFIGVFKINLFYIVMVTNYQRDGLVGDLILNKCYTNWSCHTVTVRARVIDMHARTTTHHIHLLLVNVLLLFNLSSRISHVLGRVSQEHLFESLGQTWKAQT